MKNIGQLEEALATARRALTLQPDFPPALGMVGSILAEMGSMDEAEALFRRAIALAPERLPLAYHLAQLVKVRPGEPALRAMEDAFPRIASMPPAEQCMLHFGLAKAYDDIGERDRGFNHLLLGNALKRAQIEYDEAGALAGLNQLAQVFSADLMAARGNLGDPPTPQCSSSACRDRARPWSSKRWRATRRSLAQANGGSCRW